MKAEKKRGTGAARKATGSVRKDNPNGVSSTNRANGTVDTRICIVGAGASGMTAAIAAGRRIGGRHVLVLEKLDAPGHKILATGNGRCNLTNMACENAAWTREFFRGLGVFTREEDDGRVYPWCGDARAVQQALVSEMERLGVRVRTDSAVTKIERQKDKFLIYTRGNGDVIRADRLLLACGGKAGPKLGTTGDGARLARSLSLEVKPLAPALTAVEVYEDVGSLKGIRARGKAALYYKDLKIDEETGEIQFTAYGVSGICIFNLSRKMVLPPGKNLKDGFDDYRVVLDLADGLTIRKEDFLGVSEQNLLPLESVVRRPLAKRILEMAEGDPGRCVELLHSFTLHPKGLKGWDMAQVTRGGTALEELDWETFTVKKVPGLYVSGELQDWDGPCGGFNLQHAWETGFAAGEAMAESVLAGEGRIKE